MAKPLTDRIALVTGASRGIGYATALALARNGAHVVATARTTGGLEELDDAIRQEGGSATLVPLDIKDTEGLERLAGALHARYQRLDILVGNAAILGGLSPLSHIEPKVWADLVAINISANWHLIRCFDGLLRASDAGRAVMITSGAASKANAYWGGYATSKAALDTMTRTWAAELATTPAKANLFNPGATRTRMRALAMPGENPDTLTTADAVAEKIVELCLPSCVQNGELYDFRAQRFLNFHAPD